MLWQPHAFPYKDSCSGKTFFFYFSLWSLMLWKTSCIILWSLMLWKSSYHCLMEPHALETPLCRSWSLDLGKILQFCIGHTIYWLTLHTLFDSDTPIIWSQTTHNLGLNHTFTYTTTLFQYKKLFFNSNNNLSFSSIQSTFSFLLSCKLFSNIFFYFHKRTIIICSLAVRLKA